ncbi:MAG: hypothetical protein QNJ72_39280, partial [Pleurocapsa sp. MO_226.B13]|nr:hypothetical protein [Pleurocapsa sp. MO_226.B13]
PTRERKERKRTREKTPKREKQRHLKSGGYREGIGQGGQNNKCEAPQKIARRSLCNPCRALRGLGCPQITNRDRDIKSPRYT